MILPLTEGWHLDKRVPLAIILALAMQTVGLITWAMRLDARVNALEQTQLALAPDRAADRASGMDRSQRIIRLETQYDGVKEALAAINQKLDRLTDEITSLHDKTAKP